jgi:branched-chain amino acid transport system ATP-binding protein
MISFLDVRNLQAFYGKTAALHGVAFQMEEGSVTALLGANGAGKTTTLRAISGMIKRSGEIMLRGGFVTLTGRARAARRVRVAA